MLAGKRPLIVTAVLLTILVGSAGLFFLSPYIAIYRFGTAASAKNSQELSKLIDFHSLKTNLRPRIHTLVKQEIDTNAWGTRLDQGTRLLIAGFLIDPLTDLIVSPAGLDALLDDQIRRSYLEAFSPKRQSAQNRSWLDESAEDQPQSPPCQSEDLERGHERARIEKTLDKSIKALKPCTQQMLSQSSYQNINTFTVPLCVPNGRGKRTCYMTFTRDGLFTWQLTDIELDAIYTSLKGQYVAEKQAGTL